MSVVLSLLQVTSLAIGSSAENTVPVVEDPAAINTTTQLVMMDDYQFFSIDPLSNDCELTTEQHGAFYLLSVLNYLDAFISDSVVSEENDFTTNDFSVGDSVYIYSPVFFVAAGSLYSQLTISWLETFLSNNNLTYDYTNNAQTFPLADDQFFYQAFNLYLTSRGFVQGNSALEGDYYIEYGRQHYYLGVWSDEQSETLIEAVDNNWPCIFTINGLDPLSVYPYFCVGYYVTTYYDPVNDRDESSYQFLGYNPETGLRIFNPDKLVKACVVDLHVSHSHSNNLYSPDTGHNYCYCGQITGCDTHNYHYVRLNALYHQATCEYCGYSIRETHSGRYCICMLQD